MKLSKWIFGTALLLSAQMASVQGAGYDSCDPCDPCYENPCDICDIDFCDVEYAFSVDALYWEICRSDLDLGENDDDVEKYLNPGFHWGYRLIGTARWNCWDLGFRYTSLCAEESKFLPVQESIKATFKLDLDVLDIELGYTCCLDCGLVFRPFLGAKLAWIDDDYIEKEEGTLFDESKIDFDGYGLYIGTSMRWELTKYCLCDREIPIALVARANAGVLRGDFEYDLFGDNKRDHHCILIPVQEYYAGLDFTFCDLCGWDAFFQLGYEAQYWGWREYFNDSDTAHLGLHGLVLRFGASF